MIDKKIKIGWYVVGSFTGVLCSYTGIKQEIIFIIAILVFVDFITGVASSISRKQQVASARMVRGIVAKSFAIMIPFILALMGKVIQVDLSSIIFAALSIFAVSESYSIIGNIYEIHEGEEVTEQDSITILFKYLLKFLNDKLESLYQDKHNDKEKDS